MIKAYLGICSQANTVAFCVKDLSIQSTLKSSSNQGPVNTEDPLSHLKLHWEVGQKNWEAAAETVWSTG